MGFFSGGKDSVYAICSALDSGIHVDFLVYTQLEFPRPSPHQLNLGLINRISEALGIPLIQVDGKQISSKLRDLGAELVIAGNISIIQHREWWEQICAGAGADYLEPLWNSHPSQVLLEMIRYGIRAMIIGLDSRMIPEDWLGRILDLDSAHQLIELADAKKFDPCGENGEYHSIVVDCPRFKHKLKLYPSRKICHGHYRILILE